MLARLAAVAALAVAAAVPAAADPPDTCVMTANEQFHVCRSGTDRDCVYGYSSGTQFESPTCHL